MFRRIIMYIKKIQLYSYRL